MKEYGTISGFLLSKLNLGLAVLLLISSVLTLQKGLDRKQRRRKLDQVAEIIGDQLRKIDSLPGEAKLERKLPSLEKSYELEITGSNGKMQSVKILAKGEENARRILYLSQKVNGGKFRISKKDPRKIAIKKSDQISIELM